MTDPSAPIRPTFNGSLRIEGRPERLTSEPPNTLGNCIDYAMLHEMADVPESNLNARFRGVMAQFLPAWNPCREILNRATLGSQHWGC